MKTARFERAYLLVGGVILLLNLCILPGRVQAAVVQGRASAEVVNFALVDSARLLAEAGGAGPTEGLTLAQTRPEVKLSTNEGVSWLSIDYN
jgi:hypothetical protein